MSKDVSKNNDSRVNNFVRNSVVGIITQLFSLILSFVSRTIFIKLLSNSYLSVNGLFYNILSTLSFVELGFGSALLYMMYRPAAEDDREKLKTYVRYYRNIYFVIGITIFVLGILIIPFMGFIIKNPPKITDNLNYIYILFLINVCIGYFYSHKTSLLYAYQKNYIISLYSQIFKWVQLVLQIIVLLVTKNYILYLWMAIICTLLNNIVVNRNVNKIFPFIKEKNVKEIPKSEKKKINSKVKSLIFYKLGPSILNGSDNIILSAIIGIESVGIYSNYYLITSYLSLFLNQITGSLESSIGNLNAKSEPEHKEKIFYNVLYICFFIYGICCVLLFGLINDFINIWIGKEFLFNNFIVFSIVLFIYINGVTFASHSFRTTSGVFEKEKIVPLFEVIVNIGVSIFLAKKIGIAGVFLGTSIAKLSTLFWTDPILLHKYIFENKNYNKYFIKYIIYSLITLFSGFVVYNLSTCFVVTNYLYWGIKAIILTIITVLLFIVFTFKTKEYKELLIIFKEKFGGKIRK